MVVVVVVVVEAVVVVVVAVALAVAVAAAAAVAVTVMKSRCGDGDSDSDCLTQVKIQIPKNILILHYLKLFINNKCMDSNTKNLHMWILYNITHGTSTSIQGTTHIILTLSFTYTVPYQLTLTAPMSSQTQERGPMLSSNLHVI